MSSDQWKVEEGRTSGHEVSEPTCDTAVPIQTFTRRISHPLFSLRIFFDDTVIGHIIEWTMLYPGEKVDHLFSTYQSEIRTDHSILFISGYNHPPAQTAHLLVFIGGPLQHLLFKIMPRKTGLIQKNNYLHLANN